MLHIKECFVRQNTGTGKISPQQFFLKLQLKWSQLSKLIMWQQTLLQKNLNQLLMASLLSHVWKAWQI